MTESEALELGKKLYANITSNANNIIKTNDYIEFVRIVNKSIEKQIPKKIVKHNKCPVCNNNQSTTWYYVGASYCEYCGQKLSWESDTD